MAQMRMWTSRLVEQAKEKLRHNLDADLSCFHEKDIELKGGRILFQTTPEEVAEFTKCSMDINYFVEKYCRFLTDKGRQTVQLRKYQTEILDDLAEEDWNDKLDDVGPKNRNYILMSSRQTGKCFFDGEVEIKNKNNNFVEKVSINLLYLIKKQSVGHLSFIENIKFFLYKLYNLL